MTFVAPERLGVGCSLLPSLSGLFAELSDVIDFVEIGPDTLCREVRRGRHTTMCFVPDLLDEVLHATAGLPTVVHGVELSIGTASGWNDAYLDVLDEWRSHRGFPWHSEHIGFLFTRRGERICHAGVPLPLPFTREAVTLVAGRARTIGDRYGVPFLLENAAYYLGDLPHDNGWDEATFLNELVAAGDCGLLLDLFNLYVNATNHHLDPLALLERMPLERVVEVHIAGGDEAEGFLLDSHSGAVPEPVWAMLEWLLPRAPNVAGVVFEVLESHFPRVGLDLMRRQLKRLRDVWDRHKTVSTR
jgi:uncharacterized protein (UPF0276 family)